MEVTLQHATPLIVCANAMRTCWNSHDRSDNGGPIDLALIEKVGNKNNHSSTLEHLNYTFFISGISRACLQELARHRHASLSVKSTRYTLKELKKEPTPTTNLETVNKFCVLTGIEEIDNEIALSLARLQQLVKAGLPNDKTKFALPESYKTELTWTINMRSLQNFLSLRTSNSAMWEIRELAYEIFNQIPDDHKYLARSFLHKESKQLTPNC